MKKFKYLICFIMGGIVFSTFYVSATMNANGIAYNSTTSVKDALDGLYSKLIYKKYGNGTAIYFNPETNSICDKDSAVSTSGTKTGCMKWYIFNDSESSNTVNMILDHNTTAQVQYNSTGDASIMKEALDALNSDTSTWHTSLNTRLITASEIALITGYTDWKGSWYYFESNSQIESNLQGTVSKYAWLYDYTVNCKNSGCSVAASEGIGYWTSTMRNAEYVYGVDLNNALFMKKADQTTNTYGIRPVITVLKFNLL